jgi:hypothetical protein
MARMYLRRGSAVCVPTAVGSSQTWSFPVKKGWRIKQFSMQRLVAAAGSTTSTFGARLDATAGGAANGLLAVTDTEGTVGSIVDGAGADLNSGRGYLVPTDGLLVIDYTIGATPGATNPAARFTWGYTQDFPF